MNRLGRFLFDNNAPIPSADELENMDVREAMVWHASAYLLRNGMAATPPSVSMVLLAAGDPRYLTMQCLDA